MDLTRYEMETILNFNEEEQTASVYTHNKALRRKLDKLAQDRPGECRLVKTGHDGKAADYTIPKGWIRIHPPRVPAPLTEEQKQKRREHLASLRNG